MVQRSSADDRGAGRRPDERASDGDTGAESAVETGASPLSVEFREFLDRKADRLAEIYQLAFVSDESDESYEDTPWHDARDYHDSEMQRAFDDQAFQYTQSGSTDRTVAVVGRTFRHELVLDDRTGIVVKFQPWLGVDSVAEARGASADNRHEIAVWREAVERGDEDLFATIFDADDRGRWLVMERCIPIYLRGAPRRNSPPHDALAGRRWRDEFEAFRDRFEERGWYEHDFAHGNIGVDGGGDVVLLDFGSFTNHPASGD